MLDGLFRDVHALLEDEVAAEPDPLAAMVGIGTAVDIPKDPAVARLLPDAHRDDEEASSEFRRYTEMGLRDRKRSGLALARTTLAREGTLRLDHEEAGAWVVALTDVRLVLAERMGLRTDDDHDLLVSVVEQLASADRDEQAEGVDDDAGEQLAAALGLYDYLAWLQETLVEALSAALPSVPRTD